MKAVEIVGKMDVAAVKKTADLLAEIRWGGRLFFPRGGWERWQLVA